MKWYNNLVLALAIGTSGCATTRKDFYLNQVKEARGRLDDLFAEDCSVMKGL